jgi:hypothetical protein
LDEAHALLEQISDMLAEVRREMLLEAVARPSAA